MLNVRHATGRRFARVREQGFLLIEGMIAVLILALGILGLVAMAGTALGSQTDSRVRTQAAALVNEVVNQITLKVDRSNLAAFTTSMATFAHRPTGTNCAFTGSGSADPVVAAWATKVAAGGVDGLPGAAANRIQVLVDTSATAFNRVEVTLCWQAPSDIAPRRHTHVTYVNLNF